MYNMDLWMHIDDELQTNCHFTDYFYSLLPRPRDNRNFTNILINSGAKKINIISKAVFGMP